MSEKMLRVCEVMEILNVSQSTAYEKIREVNDFLKRKNKNIKFIKGRVREQALKEYYGLN